MHLPILSLIAFTPLVGALVVAALPSNHPDFIRRTALGFALAAWAMSLLLLAAYALGPAGFQFGETADWIPTFGIQYKVGVDGLSVLMVVLSTTLSWISILASFGPIKDRVKGYMISFLVLEVGMIGVFIALDLFLFYIFWEIVLVPMYLIIGIWGGANRIYATMKFVLYTLVGSLLMLVAILATAYAYQVAHGGSWVGAFDYERLQQFAAAGGFGGNFQLLAFGALFLAFAIKVPMFPFHTWLPDAHTEAPTAGSVILAGVLLKLGCYGLIRFAVPLYPHAAHTFAWPIIVLSIVAIVYGAIVSIVQPDLKRLIAYSSVSHMGFVTLGIFVFSATALQGAILQMISHGLITGGLFLLVGVVYERTHDRTIAKMGGLAATMPLWSTVFGFLSSAAIIFMMIAVCRHVDEEPDASAPASKFFRVVTRVAVIAWGIWVAFNLCRLVLTPYWYATIPGVAFPVGRTPPPFRDAVAAAARMLLSQASLFIGPYVIWRGSSRPAGGCPSIEAPSKVPTDSLSR